MITNQGLSIEQSLCQCVLYKWVTDYNPLSTCDIAPILTNEIPHPILAPMKIKNRVLLSVKFSVLCCVYVNIYPKQILRSVCDALSDSDHDHPGLHSGDYPDNNIL